MKIRTDLAAELHEQYMSSYGKNHGGEPDGVAFKQKKIKGFDLTEIEITNEEGERIIGKPKGKYVTLNVGKLWNADFESFRVCADILAKTVEDLSNNAKTTLVAGLGNRYITADAIGPCAVKHVIATHHICKMEVYKNSGLGDVAAITPGVLAQTGYEAKDQIISAISSLKPDRLIVIDALAAKSIDTLTTTVQITNTGISPGSGVGNDRGELSEKVLGIPVIAIGVPTMVDASTLVYSVLPDDFDRKSIEYDRLEGCYVCPKDSDKAISELGRLIGYAVNRVCHKELPYADMAYI